MKSKLMVVTVLALLAAAALLAAPAQAVTGNWFCTVTPGTGPVGTVFHVACSGFTPGATANIYAVEPDGRASGLNIYGFFPTNVKVDKTGALAFNFVTEFPGFFSVPPGDYTFVIQELVPDGGGQIAVLAKIPITVTSPTVNLGGALLIATPAEGTFFTIVGTGFAPFEAVNIWITQPPAAQCSGLGIDQLTLAALAGNGSSLWVAPGTVKADNAGDISFTVLFRPSACRGEHTISVRALGSGAGAAVTVLVNATGPTFENALVLVTPSMVPMYHSFHLVSGSFFPPNTGVNCWYTRPDGRVLGFINVNAKTDSAGNFTVGNTLDDFPPFTSTEPGLWTVTCATPDKSAIGTGTFTVFGMAPDP